MIANLLTIGEEQRAMHNIMCQISIKSFNFVNISANGAIPCAGIISEYL